MPKGTEKTEIRYQQQHFFFELTWVRQNLENPLHQFILRLNAPEDVLLLSLELLRPLIFENAAAILYSLSRAFIWTWALHEQPGSGYSRMNFSQTVIGHLGQSQVTESMKCSFTCSNFGRETP